jgi:ATPase subunit of ABC transporter with duplicated ATPase domains
MALEVEGLSKGYDESPLFSNLELNIEVGERIAVIGPNGIGKSTLLRTLVDDLAPDSGEVKWSENANIGYFAQDHAADFAEDRNLFDWMEQWKQPGDDEQVVRGTLGRMLFSADDIKKSVKVVSGGEQGRLLFGKLMMQKPNILVMDEPTNHLDMESIESLNLALENFPGTLIFVSHDREFVSSLATRIIELTPDGIVDFGGGYEEYLHSQGVA